MKADFLGLTKEINGVPHGDLLPLTEKWVITISSQYGCSMQCKFCDVPDVGKGINVTFSDLIEQVNTCIDLHPEVIATKRLNVHFARMGEPTYNYQVLYAALFLAGIFKNKGWRFHPVVSTMMPKRNKHIEHYLHEWLRIKSILDGEAGLQISINSTDEDFRSNAMPEAMSLMQIGKIFKRLFKIHRKLKGRKIALNFAISDKTIIIPWKLKQWFDPTYFLCKITPMHATWACKKNNLHTSGGYDFYYPYKHIEESLKQAGYDVIVFVPSKEEDESQITCGNAILMGDK